MLQLRSLRCGDLYELHALRENNLQKTIKELMLLENRSKCHEVKVKWAKEGNIVPTYQQKMVSGRWHLSFVKTDISL